MDINITTPTATQVNALKRDGSNANSDVDLGAYALNANSFKINGTAGAGHIDLKHQSADATSPTSSTALWADANGDIKWKIDGNYKTILKTSGNNADRTYTFQNANGTLAFTSDIPSLAPYLTIAAAAAAYEPIFSKGTAFNKNFGTSSGDILLQTGTTANQILVTDSNNKVTSQAKGTAYNRNFGTSSGDILLQSGTVASRMLITDGSNQVTTTSFSSGDIVLLNQPQTLTNKTISGASNTFSNISTSSILGYEGYSLQFSNNSFSPADATTYFFGGNQTQTATVGGTGGSRRIYIPKTGTIKAIYLFFLNSGTLGSNETSTIYIRLNATTDTTISSSITNDSAQLAFNATGLSISVVAGDYFEIKWITPTWVTNPTNVILNGSIYFE